MKEGNQSTVKDFLIVGFSDLPQLQVLLCVAFSLVYLTTLFGNSLIMVTICYSTHLHKPMYFFLINLSLNDICYTSIIFPMMLVSFFENGTLVSFTACLLQLYFLLVMLVNEYVLLSVMAFDRYVAICNPLRYTRVMNKAACIYLAAGTWAISFLIPLPHIGSLSQLSFCKSHTIDHFFCDVTALVKISCSNTHNIEKLNYIVGSVVSLISFLPLIVSYVNVVSSVLKMKSKVGRHKAFSTCVSHLTVVVLFYGSIIGTYMHPTSTYSMRDSKISSLSYIALTPLCNPIIYTLKNTEFKNALRKKNNTG